MNEPCAVYLWLRDGSEREEVFASRWLAELYLYQLPYLMLTLPDGGGIAAAILSPLVAVGAIQTQ